VKIAIVCPDDFTAWHFYKGLLKALKERDYDVYVVTAQGEYIRLIEGLGVIHIPIQMYRFISPIKDLRFLINLYKIFCKYSFDIVHNFTIKPNIYGAIAARMSGVKNVFGTVEGLGFMYSKEGGLKIKLLRPLVSKLYQLSCSLSNRFWFVNPDDLTFFVSEKIIRKQKAVLIKSIGINVKEYSLNAVSNVRMAKFILVGPIEKGSPLSVPQEYLREKEKSENFQWLGFRKDIKEILALSDLVVLPSYYREGIPRSLLEAMALEKPIITTNSAGCKEVVEDGKNGYLIPIKDSKALADAIEVLINDDKKRADFGRYSRLKAEKEFDEKVVVDRIIKELYEL